MRIQIAGGFVGQHQIGFLKQSTGHCDALVRRQVAPMHNNRIYHTLTMLADGTVLALGGESSGDQSVVTSGVLQAEIWNPDTETWSTGPSMAA